MDKEFILNSISKKKEVKDYFYIILFLLTSSFFIIYIIKPSLITAFSLQEEISNLKVVSEMYDRNIEEIQKAGNFLEKIRDKVDLVDESIPEMPDTKTLIDDIKKTASNEGIVIKNLSLSSVDIKSEDEKSKDVKTILVNMEVKSDYFQLYNLVKGLTDQRRLKTIKRLQISKTDKNISSDESSLKLYLEVFGYYL